MPREQLKDVDVVNVRFSNELVSLIDSLIDKGYYKSRSEAIRDLLREQILES